MLRPAAISLAIALFVLSNRALSFGAAGDMMSLAASVSASVKSKAGPKNALVMRAARKIVLAHDPESNTAIRNELQQYFDWLTRFDLVIDPSRIVDLLKRDLQQDISIAGVRLREGDIFLEKNSQGWGTLLNGLVRADTNFEHSGLVHYREIDGFRIPTLLEVETKLKMNPITSDRDLTFLRLKSVDPKSVSIGVSRAIELLKKRSISFDAAFGTNPNHRDRFYCSNFVTEVFQLAGFPIKIDAKPVGKYQRLNISRLGLPEEFKFITPDDLESSPTVEIVGRIPGSGSRPRNSSSAETLDRAFATKFSSCKIREIGLIEAGSMLLEVLSEKDEITNIAQGVPLQFKMQLFRYLNLRKAWIEHPHERTSQMRKLDSWFQSCKPPGDAA